MEVKTIVIYHQDVYYCTCLSLVLVFFSNSFLMFSEVSKIIFGLVMGPHGVGPLLPLLR